MGEAIVVNTMFGKARVHIVHKQNQNQSGWLWLLAAFAVLVVMGVIWLRLAMPPSPETRSVSAAPVQLKPQTPPESQTQGPQIPGLNAPVQSMPVQNIPVPTPKTTITAQPAIQQPVITEPVKQAPAKKLSHAGRPKKPPVATSDDQPKRPKGTEQTDETPVPVPVSINPAVTQPAVQFIKTPSTADKPVSGSGARTSPPAVNDQQPAQTGTQP